MESLLFKNATLLSSSGRIKGDILIKDGKIKALGSDIAEKGAIEHDCTGLFILPGAIDMHVHFRDPGSPEKEDFATGSKAAASGGITFVADMPNTTPPTVTLAALEEKRRIGHHKSVVNFGLYMGFTSDNLAEIERAKDILGVKVYTASSTGNLLLENLHLIEKLFERGLFVIVHAEDEKIIRANQTTYQDRDDPAVHSLIRSREAAFEGVRAVLHCAKKCGGRVHITHVSTKEEVEELRKFKSPLVTADATPHNLFLTQDEYERQGNLVKVNPPLRTKEDQKALWEGLHDGTITAIATDHAPHTLADKKKSYWEAPSGVPGVETMLPLLLDAVNHAQLNLEDVARLTSQSPARILGLTAKGSIEVGKDADLVVVDMEKRMQVGAHGYISKSGWSPFAGRMLKGWPVMTIVNGKIVS